MIELKRKTQTHAGRAEMALNALEAGQDTQSIPAAESSRKRQGQPFTGYDSSRDYKAMYADVFKFHTKYNPPDIADKGKPGGYWWTLNEEMIQLANRYGNDAFMNGLLNAVYNELEREYQQRTEK